MLRNEDYLRLCGVELMVFSSGSVGVRREIAVFAIGVSLESLMVGVTVVELGILRCCLGCILSGGGLLAPPSEKADLLKDMSLCFPTWVLYLNSARSAMWAFWRAGVQETATEHWQSCSLLPQSCPQDVLEFGDGSRYHCSDYSFCLIYENCSKSFMKRRNYYGQITEA
jgi:hypothetical protein